MVARTWSLRHTPKHWDFRFTSLGGRLSDAKDLMGGSQAAAHLREQRSGVFIATRDIAWAAGETNRAYFLHLVQHIVQRGLTPPVPHAVENLILSQAAKREESGLRAEHLPYKRFPVTNPAVPPLGTEFDSPWERDAWAHLCQEFAHIAGSIVFQAPLAGLCDWNSDEAWADFIFPAAPGNRWRVVELDGQQHQISKTADAIRDKALRDAGLEVTRCTTGTWHDEFKKLRTGLSTLSESLARANAGSSELLLFHGPSLFARLNLALALVFSGSDAIDEISIELRDDLEIAEQMLPDSLNFLSKLDQFWDLGVMPESVRVNGLSYQRATGYTVSGESNAPANSLVALQSLTAEADELPEDFEHAIVIRTALRPHQPPYLPKHPFRSRYASTDSEKQKQALQALLPLMTELAEFRTLQPESILAALSRSDSIVLLPTGAGKSLVYLMAGLLRPGMTVVIDPLSALIDDQQRRFREMGIDRVLGLHSSQGKNVETKSREMSGIGSGDFHFLLISPERLQIVSMQNVLSQCTHSFSIPLAVLDEAHCISEWGHDFRIAYLNVGRNLRDLCASVVSGDQPSLLCLTGTASPRVLTDLKREIENDLKAGTLNLIKPVSHDRPNLEYRLIGGRNANVLSESAEAVRSLVPAALNLVFDELVRPRGSETSAGILFTVNAKGPKGVVRLSEVIKTLLPEDGREDWIAIYSGKPPFSDSEVAMNVRDWDRTKSKYARDFISNNRSIMVATKAFGMGIDKGNVRWTVHAGQPASIEQFAQEAGRAGRDGERSVCVLVCSLADSEVAQKLFDYRTPVSIRRHISESLPKSVDLSSLYFFHQSNFSGIETELAALQLVIAELAAKTSDFASDSLVDLPMRFQNLSAEQTERAIYKLTLLEIVDSYVVDFAKNIRTLSVRKLSPSLLDRAIVRQLNRLEPGKSALNQTVVRNAPSEISLRCNHYVELLIERTYQVLEPARLRAIESMYNLCASNPTPEEFRSAINEYLGEGELAPILDQFTLVEQIDLKAVVGQLRQIASDTSDEWIGSSSRRLEEFPDNPVLLAVRAVGEGARAEANLQVMQSNLRQSFAAMPQYNLSFHDGIELLDWVTEKSCARASAAAEDQVRCAISAWEESGADMAPLERWEVAVLRRSAVDVAWVKRANAIRAKRMERVKTQVNELILSWDEDAYVRN